MGMPEPGAHRPSEPVAMRGDLRRGEALRPHLHRAWLAHDVPKTRVFALHRVSIQLLAVLTKPRHRYGTLVCRTHAEDHAVSLRWRCSKSCIVATRPSNRARSPLRAGRILLPIPSPAGVPLQSPLRRDFRGHTRVDRDHRTRQSCRRPTAVGLPRLVAQPLGAGKAGDKQTLVVPSDARSPVATGELPSARRRWSA